jgi:hypothetical protein
MREVLVSDLEQRAKETLERSSIYVLRELHVEQDGDVLVLTGCVDSYYHKQLAQELIRLELEGVEVANCLEVDYNRPRRMPRPEWA